MPGIGAPSQAAEALEMGADAVLVNTAIAAAADPVRDGGRAFRMAVECGREAFEAGLPNGLTLGASIRDQPAHPFLDSL